MKHVIIFYYFFSFFVGVLGLTVCGLSLLKSSNRKLLYFFISYACLALFILINTFYFYSSAIVDIPGTFPNLLMAYLFFIIFFIFYRYVPKLELEITGRKPSRPESIALAVAPWLAVPLAILPLFAGKTPDDVLRWAWFDLYDVYCTLFYLVFLHSLLRFIIFTFTLKSGDRKGIYLTASILLMISIPCFLIDAYWQFFKVTLHLVPKDFNFTPLMFLLIGLFSTLYGIRYFFLRPAEASVIITELPPSFKAAYQLTDREADVALYSAQGLSHQQIADKLYIAISTVRNYMSDMYRKTGVNNKLALIQLIQQHTLSEKQTGLSRRHHV